MAPPPKEKQAAKNKNQVGPTRNTCVEAPLTIENLPSRIQQGACRVLPPKFGPPTAIMPSCPMPMPCPNPCFPQGPCFYPSPPPCSPFGGGGMFCGPIPPCTPMPLCPPPYCCPTPYPCCPPTACCMPPPVCCPPPRCCTPCCPPMKCCPPKICCTPCCPPKCCKTPNCKCCCCPEPCCDPCCDPCCPPRCCTGGTKQIVCIPRGLKKPAAVGGGGGCCPPKKKNNCCPEDCCPPPCPPPPQHEPPPSYNNCNFYLSQMPKGLEAGFGGNGGGGQCCPPPKRLSTGNGNGGRRSRVEEQCCCSEEEDEDDCDDYSDDEDDCCEEPNRGGGDDQCFHPPQGYPGSHRKSWGDRPDPCKDPCRDPCEEPDPCADPCAGGGRGMDGHLQEMCFPGMGGRDPRFSRNGGGNGNGNRRSSGGASGRGRPSYGSGGQDRRGSVNTASGGGREGAPSNGRNSFGRSSTAAGPSARTFGTNQGGDGRSMAASGRSRQTTAGGGGGVSRNPTKTTVGTQGPGRSSLFRDYLYEDDELTSKSQAYLPGAYPGPTPHQTNSKIHPLRAPVTNYRETCEDIPSKSGAKSGTKSGGFKSTKSGATSKGAKSGARSGATSKCTTTNGGTTSRSMNSKYTHVSSRPTTQDASSMWTSTECSSTTAGTMGPSCTTTQDQSRVTSQATRNLPVGPDENQYTREIRDDSSFAVSSRAPTSIPPKSKKGCHPFSRSQKTVAQSHPETIKEDPECDPDPPPAPTGAGDLGDIIQVGQVEVEQDMPDFCQSPEDPDPCSTQQSGMAMTATTTACPSTAAGAGGDHDSRKRKRGAAAKNDPCEKTTCFNYNSRRLHRLCSFSKRRSKRLSQLHGNTCRFLEPACPIRETMASILRKKDQNPCKWHDRDIPPYHEYCMTDHNRDTNRHMLLTRNPSKEVNGNNGGIEARGAKRKNHHR